MDQQNIENNNLINDTTIEKISFDRVFDFPSKELYKHKEQLVTKHNCSSNNWEDILKSCNNVDLINMFTSVYIEDIKQDTELIEALKTSMIWRNKITICDSANESFQDSLINKTGTVITAEDEVLYCKNEDYEESTINLSNNSIGILSDLSMCIILTIEKWIDNPNISLKTLNSSFKGLCSIKKIDNLTIIDIENKSILGYKESKPGAELYNEDMEEWHTRDNKRNLSGLTHFGKLTLKDSLEKIGISLDINVPQVSHYEFFNKNKTFKDGKFILDKKTANLLNLYKHNKHVDVFDKNGQTIKDLNKISVWNNLCATENIFLYKEGKEIILSDKEVWYLIDFINTNILKNNGIDGKEEYFKIIENYVKQDFTKEETQYLSITSEQKYRFIKKLNQSGVRNNMTDEKKTNIMCNMIKQLDSVVLNKINNIKKEDTTKIYTIKKVFNIRENIIKTIPEKYTMTSDFDQIKNQSFT